MKLFLTAILLIFSSAPSTFAQNKSFDVNNLKIAWKFIDDNYNNSPQFFSAITFTITGEEAFPATGWNIFFNSIGGSKASYNSPHIKIESLNGDLFRLSPIKGFKAIKPGTSKRIEFLSKSRIRNISDLPSGFYLVWDTTPEKGFAINNVDIKPSFISKKPNLVTPEAIYTQNKIIRDIPEEKLPKIFPTPVDYRETGVPFELNADVQIVADADFKREASLLADELSSILGKRPIISSAGKGKVIILKKNNVSKYEAYQLSVSPEKITIEASSAAGIFYAIQSFKVMLPPKSWSGIKKTIMVPGVEITDYPRFGFRGFMMDVARNFQPKEVVLKMLDVMALYKLNVLHFHLNDDEGWRLEIPALPELVQVGAKRGHTLDSKQNLPPSFGSGPDINNMPGSGFYSKADFIEILKYANDRHIRVIPEIETPGHARAAIKSMDARYERLMKEGRKTEAEQYLLRDLNDQSVYRSVQNWPDNVINVALPSTYNFIETVVDEIIKMYKEAAAPLHTIHFGGDEVPEGVWKKSSVVQNLMKQDLSITNTDDLWYYYFGKVNQILKSRNLYLSGWEEIALRKTELDGKKHMIPNPVFANENFHVNAWRNNPGSGAEDLAYKLANQGYKVVLTCVTNLYFDLAANKSFDEPGLYWGGYVDIDKPYYFVPYNYFKTMKEDDMGNPFDKSIFNDKVRLTDYGKTNIVGIQAPLWSETIKSPERLEYMLLPKLLGLAERAWSKDPAWATEQDSLKSKALYNQAWSEFVNILGKKELPRLDYYAGGYNYRIPTAGVIVENGTLDANVQFPGLIIRYTTDGTEPTVNSKKYTNPVTEKGTIIFRVFNTTGRAGRAVKIENKN